MSNSAIVEPGRTHFFCVVQVATIQKRSTAHKARDDAKVDLLVFVPICGYDQSVCVMNGLIAIRHISNAVAQHLARRFQRLGIVRRYTCSCCNERLDQVDGG